MNPINRKQKTIGRKISTHSPGLAPSINSGSRFSSKSDLLSKYREPNYVDNDDIFGNMEGPISGGFAEDFRTLKITSNELETLKPNRKSIKFQDQLDESPRIPESNYKTKLIKPEIDDIRLSSTDTLSTSSPKSSITRRFNSKTLSDYSEDDTDITSQLNDEEFEDIDNIFGPEECGIYNKINQHLINKKKQLQNDAEMEEIELNKKLNYQNQHQNEINTLKLKDFNYYSQNDINLSLIDQLDNDKTINYEYTRDDYENFEEGFENFEDINKPKLINQFQTPKTLNNKNSMPNFSQFQQQHHQSKQSIKKFKSSMDLINHGQSQVDRHPIFNNNNKIIKKLDRIPSFYNKETSEKKQNLLNKYREQTTLKKKHKRMNPVKSQEPLPAKSKKIGLVRYLNDYPIIDSNSKMKFNPVNKRWEGNDIDLIKFENINKPSLITINDVQENNKTLNRNSHMMYDNENLKWINLEEDNDSVFNDIPDLVEKSKLQSPARGISTYTQRTASTSSTVSSSINDNDEFSLSVKLIHKFLKEETKINKKIENWFNSNEIYDITDDSNKFNNDYFWEIRKMVIDNED